MFNIVYLLMSDQNKKLIYLLEIIFTIVLYSTYCQHRCQYTVITIIQNDFTRLYNITVF